MSLQDILAAITIESDGRLSDARTAHQRALTQMREESEQRIAGKRQEVAASKQRRLKQLTAKAESHAHAQKRNTILRKKKELIDMTYREAVRAMANLPEKEVEALLRACIKLIKGKGSIHPSGKHEKLLKKICPSEQFHLEKPTKAEGGFLFVSEKTERDFTFEHLVEHALRPQTELELSRLLFS